MKILLILVLVLSVGCTVTVDHKSSGTVEHVIVVPDNVIQWLDAWILTQEGEKAVSSMPNEVQRSLYGYTPFPNELNK